MTCVVVNDVSCVIGSPSAVPRHRCRLARGHRALTSAVMSRSDVPDGLSGLSVAITSPLSTSATGTIGTLVRRDFAPLQRLLRRAFGFPRWSPTRSSVFLQ